MVRFHPQIPMTRDREKVSHQPHKLKIASSNLAPATTRVRVGMVDNLVLETSAERRVGSTPTTPTII